MAELSSAAQISITDAISASRGQTSDPSIEYRLPEGYRPVIYAGSDIKTVFTQEDYKNFVAYFRTRRMYYACWRLYSADGKELTSIVGYTDGRLSGFDRNTYKHAFFPYADMDELERAGYESVRKIILCLAHLYDFDSTEIPWLVSTKTRKALTVINASLGRINQSYVQLVCYLGDIVEAKRDLGYYGCRNIYEFAERRFGLCKTTVKNLVTIRNRFIDLQNRSKKPAFAEYSYSQLVELSSVDDKDLNKFNPKMSVSMMRDLKKSIAAEAKGEQQPDKKEKSVKEKAESSNALNMRDVLAEKISGMSNPYYASDKEKQSARYDAYQKALADVLDLLRTL